MFVSTRQDIWKLLVENVDELPAAHIFLFSLLHNYMNLHEHIKIYILHTTQLIYTCIYATYENFYSSKLGSMLKEHI